MGKLNFGLCREHVDVAVLFRSAIVRQVHGPCFCTHCAICFHRVLWALMLTGTLNPKQLGMLELFDAPTAQQYLQSKEIQIPWRNWLLLRNLIELTMLRVSSAQ